MAGLQGPRAVAAGEVCVRAVSAVADSVVVDSAVADSAVVGANVDSGKSYEILTCTFCIDRGVHLV